MPRHYLKYLPWKSLQRWIELNKGVELYAASEQFRHVELDDVIWGVTIPPAASAAESSGLLHLCGRMEVNTLTEDHALVERLAGYADVWRASRYALPLLGRAEPYAQIDISDLAPRLRFEGHADRLTIEDGLVGAQQLQTMRRLTPASAVLLEQCWKPR
jgi:hypothetical protein